MSSPPIFLKPQYKALIKDLIKGRINPQLFTNILHYKIFQYFFKKYGQFDKLFITKNYIIFQINKTEEHWLGAVYLLIGVNSDDKIFCNILDITSEDYFCYVLKMDWEQYGWRRVFIIEDEEFEQKIYKLLGFDDEAPIKYAPLNYRVQGDLIVTLLDWLDLNHKSNYLNQLKKELASQLNTLYKKAMNIYLKDILATLGISVLEVANNGNLLIPLPPWLKYFEKHQIQQILEEKISPILKQKFPNPPYSYIIRYHDDLQGIQIELEQTMTPLSPVVEKIFNNINGEELEQEVKLNIGRHRITFKAFRNQIRITLNLTEIQPEIAEILQNNGINEVFIDFTNNRQGFYATSNIKITHPEHGETIIKIPENGALVSFTTTTISNLTTTLLNFFAISLLNS